MWRLIADFSREAIELPVPSRILCQMSQLAKADSTSHVETAWNNGVRSDARPDCLFLNLPRGSEAVRVFSRMVHGSMRSAATQPRGIGSAKLSALFLAWGYTWCEATHKAKAASEAVRGFPSWGQKMNFSFGFGGPRPNIHPCMGRQSSRGRGHGNPWAW